MNAMLDKRTVMTLIIGVVSLTAAVCIRVYAAGCPNESSSSSDFKKACRTGNDCSQGARTGSCEFDEYDNSEATCDCYDGRECNLDTDDQIMVNKTHWSYGLCSGASGGCEGITSDQAVQVSVGRKIWALCGSQ